MHYLSDCPLTSKDKANVMLNDYKNNGDADKKKEYLKTLDINGATAENKYGQTAYLTEENLEVEFTMLADTGSDFSAISRSPVEDASKCGFPLKVEVLPDPIMLNMSIRAKAISRSAV
jgi:hypothetical protein